MPVLKVMKNGKHLCSIGSDDVWAFSASMSMDIWGPEIATLDISGGSKRNEKGESDFLIWEISHELAKQDQLSFSFENGTTSSPKGKPFTPESKPQATAEADLDFQADDKELKEMEAQSAVNVDVAWSLSTNGRSSTKVKPDPDRQHIMLHMIWNEDSHPEAMTVNVAKKSLREIMDHNDGEIILSEALPIGSQLQLTIEN